MGAGARQGDMRLPARPGADLRALSAGLMLSLAVALGGCIGQPPETPTALDCGTEELSVGGSTNVAGRGCLLDAFQSGRPAVFTSHQTTMEGDPIARRYTVLAADLVRIEHDARRDRFGSGTVEVLHCPRLVPVDEWNQATGDSMRDEDVFVEEGCELVETRQ